MHQQRRAKNLTSTAQETTMIVRVWRGRTTSAHADNYEQFLKKTAYPDYGNVPGNRGWILLRRPVPDAVEFMFISFWDSIEALTAYTGGDSERPKYYPEDRDALIDLPENVDHYQVIDLQSRW
jgi:heme-degrading monooxygenase HmoA